MPAALLVCALILAAQTPTPPAASTQVTATMEPDVTAADLPVSIDRIQRALAGPAPIRLKEEHPVFRLEIFGRQPTIEDILGEKFWLGPAPYGGMTHADFMDMVTPQLNKPYAGFTGKYLVGVSALTLMEQWAVKSAIKHFRDAKTEHERDAARKEVLDAMTALDRAKRAAEDK
jgi:hypothetical protein